MDSHKRIQHACLTCGKVRSILLRNGQPQSMRCHPCGARYRAESNPAGWRSREAHPRWKGGVHITAAGYIQVVVPLESPFLPMADTRGRVYEHRLRIAEHLGRCLLPSEEVHHRNGNKQDNELSNLQLLSKSEHAREPYAELERLRAEVHRLRELLRQADPT